VAVQQITTPTLTKKTANLCTGVATLTVAPCPPAVGVTYTLQQVDCTTGQPLPTPTITNVSFDASTCTFTVTLPQGQTTCLRVLASNGNPACDVFSNVVSVAVPPALSLALALTANPCSGLAVVTATATGGTAPFSFSFSGAAGTTLGNTFTISPQIVTGGGINTACQMLTGTVTDANGCTATNAITFSQCLSTTPGCTP
jgi:hypothetical protein